MDTSQHLKSLGITIDQARIFVKNNLHNPAAIYDAAKQHKIDSRMLAEIVTPLYPQITSTQVEDFFTGQGLHGKGLNVAVLNPVVTTKSWQGGSPIGPLMTFNDNTGILSTESLREKVVAKVGEVKYNKTFNPSLLPGAGDGVLSTSDLGFSQLGDIEATWQNLESLYYGTMIKMLRAFSVSEYDEYVAFQKNNWFMLNIKDPATVAKMQELMKGFILDPVTEDDPCIFNDATLATSVTSALVDIVRLIGVNPDQSLFSGWGG